MWRHYACASENECKQVESSANKCCPLEAPATNISRARSINSRKDRPRESEESFDELLCHRCGFQGGVAAGADRWRPGCLRTCGASRFLAKRCRIVRRLISSRASASRQSLDQQQRRCCGLLAHGAVHPGWAADHAGVRTDGAGRGHLGECPPARRHQERSAAQPLTRCAHPPACLARSRRGTETSGMACAIRRSTASGTRTTSPRCEAT